ncbi:hypothetical protein C7476_10568 [Phyllobacterium bourgognense]|uniref:Uncharacterized protein n=1 Tax=Phyllobacterium bourgognense TaxID=314236 RepID=A0A368YTP7_9HYPH|nr:hypothetical protein C7476_10568 [Phyllobacterium bourgognense]
MRAIMQWQLPPLKSLTENSPRRAANGAVLRSDAHVPNVRSASVLGNHHFRHALTNFRSGSGPSAEHFITKSIQALIA